MTQYLVAVVDGMKARFLTLCPLEFEGYESGPNLIEHEGLVNAERDTAGQELWDNKQTGRNRAASGQSHRYDDHRNKHIVEFERRFAQAITQRIVELSQTYDTRRLILAAEPQILGILRDTMTSHLPSQLKMQEVAKDLCRMSVKELHDYLAHQSLLPAYERIGVRER
ncbi:MAG: host attachment protein [Cyanobacteria bacterium J06628_6]